MAEGAQWSASLPTGCEPSGPLPTRQRVIEEGLTLRLSWSRRRHV
jgi:hypothetical protein